MAKRQVYGPEALGGSRRYVIEQGVSYDEAIALLRWISPDLHPILVRCAGETVGIQIETMAGINRHLVRTYEEYEEVCAD